MTAPDGSAPLETHEGPTGLQMLGAPDALTCEGDVCTVTLPGRQATRIDAPTAPHARNQAAPMTEWHR